MWVWQSIQSVSKSYTSNLLSPFPIFNRVKFLCQVEISLKRILGLLRLNVRSGSPLGSVQVRLCSCRSARVHVEKLTSDIQLVEVGLEKDLDVDHLVERNLGLAKLSMNDLGSLL